MVVLEDEELQKKGVTAVAYLIGTTKFDRQASWRVASLATRALPIRLESVHICYDSPMLVPVFTVGMLSTGRFMRVRTRIHYGKSKYSLESSLILGYY